MKNTELARKYRLPEETTSEMLQERWSTVIEFGNKVLLAGYYYSNGNSWFGATYEYTTEDHTCEGNIKLTAVSTERFEDNGHALAWGMTR